jgi:hypothetical protein
MSEHMLHTMRELYIVWNCHIIFFLIRSNRIGDKIQNYIIDNPNRPFQLTSSGLNYLDLKPGTGLEQVTNDTILVRYTLKLFSGTIIDTNVWQLTLFLS